MWEVVLISFCLSFAIIYFILARITRTSARVLRRRDLSILDEFNLEHDELLSLASRNQFMSSKRSNLYTVLPDYATLKDSIKTHLTESNLFGRMQEHVFNILKSKLTKKIFCCPVANEEESKLRQLMQDMYQHFSKNDLSLINQAVLFEFRERTMLTPFSLPGSRVFQLLANYWTDAQKEKKENNTLDVVRALVIFLLERAHKSFGNCLACKADYKMSKFRSSMRSTVITMKTIAIPILVWLIDNITDVLFFIEYAQAIDDPILNSYKPREFQMLPELIYFLLVIGAVLALNALAILASLFSCNSYIPRILLRPFAVHHLMDDPNSASDIDRLIYTDTLGHSWHWQPGDVATRYQFSLSEAGAESVGKFVCEWALFFAVGFILSHRHVREISSNPLTYKTLVKSTVASVISLTLSQRKTNNLSHEFSINTSQKALYCVASFLNIIASSILLIGYTTYSYDLIVLANYKHGVVVALILTILLIVSYFIITFFTNRFTLGDMQELGTINAMPGGMGNRSSSTTYNMPVVKFLNFTDNLFNSLRLPTSAYCLQTHYTTNHNQVNAKTLGMTARHFCSFSLYFLIIGIFCSIHTILLKFDETFVFLNHLPSEEGVDRSAFIICLLLSPVYMFISLFFSWCYLCHPQFEANLHFLWMKNTCDNIGVWEDLGPATFSFWNFLGLTQNPRKGREKDEEQ